MRVLVCSFLAISCSGASSTTTSPPRVLAFEARSGHYVSHGPGYSFEVTSRAAVLTLGSRQVRMSVAGANPKASLQPLDRMPGKANYLLGKDVRASYDLYGRVRWGAVYPGVNLVFRGNQERLEYDFEIGAGRDPGTIQLAFAGIDGIHIDASGELVLNAGATLIHQPKPVAYQFNARGQRQPVDVAYWIEADQVRFRTGLYDPKRALVIDPEIVFDQSFGGSAANLVAGLTRDTQGGLYVAGTTNSTDFPTVNPIESHLATAPLLVTADAGQTWTYPSLGPAISVTAMAAGPSAPLVVYAATPTSIFKSVDGGTTWTVTASAGLAGPATTVAVDAGSSSTVYATATQGVFISTDGAASWKLANIGVSNPLTRSVVAHPTQAGTVYASFGGGNGIPNSLIRSTDSGQTWSTLNVVAPPNQLEAPVIAVLFGSNGAIILGTPSGLFISADGGNTFTAGAAVEVDNTEDLAIAPNNPNILYSVNTSGLQRSSDGGQTFTPVLPSVQFTQFSRVAVDPRNPNTVYAADNNLLYQSTNARQTWSQLSLPYPISPSVLLISPANSRVFLGASTSYNVFVTKWSADGSQILYSTYLGGTVNDQANAIAVDGSGSAYVSGYTNSPDFPTTAGAYQTKLTTSADAFVAKLSPDGSKLMYSTLLGSQGASVTSIAVDDTGNAVITGRTAGSFPVTPGAFQSAPVPICIPNFGNLFFSGDAFVTRIAPGGNALVYSTLLGGSCYSYATGLAIDASGNAWVAGTTSSANFPVTSDALQPQFGGGYYDAFLASFNPSGGLDYSTYLGGSGFDSLSAIAFDQTGNIYLTGASQGLSQPASPGAFQPQASASCPILFMGPSEYTAQGNALVLKLDPKAHSIESLTYLGAPFCLFPSSIVVDSSGEPWIAGPLNVSSAPQTANPLQIGVASGFISKFSADFTQLLFSTYFNSVSGLALDSSGFAYVAGTGASSNATGTQQAYIAKIDPTPAAISLDSIVSPDPSANPSYNVGIAPGEVIHIVGKNMGPATSTPGIIQSGILATSVAGVQVTFDGVGAPLLAVGAQEIDLVAPFELATQSVTTIQVVYNGVQSNSVQVGVNGSDVQILGVYNSDFTPNSASNPALAGSIMELYIAGLGQSSPPSEDGQVNAAPYASLGQTPQLIAYGSPSTTLTVTGASAAPGLAAGIFQVNFIAPAASLMPVNLMLPVAGNVYGTGQFNVFVH